MKKIIIIIIVFLCLSCSKKNELVHDVEVACGQCKFDMTEQKGCDLAVRLEGIPFFVSGANLDDYGDAHDKNKGLCVVIRQGKATGKIVGEKYQLSSLVFTE